MPHSLVTPMSAVPAGASHETLRLQQLMGRRVVDAGGRRLGRVVDCLAEADGDELRVVGLLVGPHAWAARFGSAAGRAERLVLWEEILALTPRITLRPRTA
jgi:sporulation protein YlmC with PRC-barrel domain